MAIYHFSVKVISRAAGSSALASAAYRAAGRLYDERLERHHDFTHKSGVIHSEVMLPEGAREEWHDREKLWNAVEAAELRKDAQLAREVEFALPRELPPDEGLTLAREFVQRTFVDQGMCADLNVHWDIGADGLAKPHAHVMLSMRELVRDDEGEIGFGAKVREWNSSELLSQWRERWAGHVNARLAELDIDVRIDHRSLETQGIALEPQSKIGAPAQRMGEQADRLIEHHEIARENGQRIIADPGIALDAITHQQSTFTRHDLAMFIHRHSDGKDQFDQAMGRVLNSPELVALGTDGRGQEHFTSREMIEVEERLHRASQQLAERELHRVGKEERDRALARAEARGLILSDEQRAALDHVTSPRGLHVVIGYAGTGKSAMLGVAREAWEDAGYRVQGVALSGIAAENLEAGSAIASRTIASLEHGWSQGRDLLSARDVLVIDEAGMVGSRQMERLLSHAAQAGAHVVLVGDPQQLQAIEAGAALRSIAERVGSVEIGSIRRQSEEWQRDATRQLATGRTAEALEAYRAHDMVHAAPTRAEARSELIERWDNDRQVDPDASRIILTHSNDEVRLLNTAARERLRDAGALGEDVQLIVERGERNFATGDRVMFLRNERSLDVKNGSLGTIVQIDAQRMTVCLDDGRNIGFEHRDYAHIDHGYAATIHKAQGMTVDRVHVLATPGMDSHASYVALSRHRQSVELHHGRDDFADDGKLARLLGRERAKDMASDYRREEALPGHGSALTNTPTKDRAKEFAERRGISWRERVVEAVRQIVPERARDMFEGLRLKPVASPPQRGMFDGFVPRAPSIELPHAVEEDRATALRRAVQRHAHAVGEILSMRERQLAVLPHQSAALDKARTALGSLDPHAASTLERAYKAEPGFAAETATGRTQRAIRALQLEAELRADPAHRADRFVSDWNRLERQRNHAWQQGDLPAMRKARDAMGVMAKELHRDPQLESLLTRRKQDLGIGFSPEGDLRRGLLHYLGLGRGRQIDIGM